MRTYRFHDYNGKRLAIFGELKGDKLEIFILSCSVKDQFNKELARSVYAAYQDRGLKGCKNLGYTPEIVEVDVKGQEDQCRNIFNEYCWENFHNPYAHTILQLEVPTSRINEVLELLKTNNLL